MTTEKQRNGFEAPDLVGLRPDDRPRTQEPRTGAPLQDSGWRPARRPREMRPVPAEVTAAVTRGVCRWLEEQGFVTLIEFKLANRRRADIAALSAKGTLLMVEVKSTPEDFRGDAKWLEYIPYCDSFAFAVPTHFPWQILPPACGVIIADAHSATLVRPAPHHALHGARRKALTLHFALTAGQRLQGVFDPRF